MLEQLRIRQIQAEDNEALASLIRRVFEEHGAPQAGTVYSDPTTDNLFKLFRRDRSVLWVAEVSGEILGCCGIYPTDGLDEGHAELVKFYLSEKARGKGIGRSLLLQCLQSAADFGYQSLYLESLPHFSMAVSMYERLGFERLDRPLGSSGHTSCNIWMIKRLKHD